MSCSVRTLALLLVLVMTAKGEEGRVFPVERIAGRDAASEVQQAIAAAIQSGPGAEIRLGPGRFDLTGPDNTAWCLTLAHACGEAQRGGSTVARRFRMIPPRGAGRRPRSRAECPQRRRTIRGRANE